MKASHLFSFLGGAALVLGLSMANQSNAQSSSHVYELRMYHVTPGKMENVKARFRDHADAMLKRSNIRPIGYFVAQDAPNAKNLFVYLLEHSSRQQVDKGWNAFLADAEWPKVKAEAEAQGSLIADKNIDRFFLDPTTFSALK